MKKLKDTKHADRGCLGITRETCLTLLYGTNSWELFSQDQVIQDTGGVNISSEVCSMLYLVDVTVVIALEKG